MIAEPVNPAVAAGTTIGRYRIRSFIASGGMGEVYAATDESLGREVALKLLPAGSQSDAVRIERFLREAHASSALNHPAIVSVYDAGVAGGHCFIAMELVDGQPLSKWLRGRRDLQRGIELMAQVADGLARAHAAGIVHRDLKPDNIMVARAGYAKILDFGIAKLIERTDGERSRSDTAPDALLGTAAYMSPEQIDGRAVDQRSDVFSLGAVLFEVVTSRKAFEGATPVDTMHAILHRPPSFDGIDGELARIVRRCLARDPEDRYHSMRDIALDLREYVRVTEKPRIARRRFSWALFASAPILVAAMLWLTARAGFAPAAVAPSLPQSVMVRVTNSGKVSTAAMSPDGRYVVYAAGEGEASSIWVKQIASGTTVRILGPEPSAFPNVQISRDGNYIYYARYTHAEPNVTDIYQLPILGGQPRRIATDTEYGFTLSPDQTRLAFRRYSALNREHRLTIAPIDGGAESILLRRKFPAFIDMPAWSPAGDSIAIVAGVSMPKSSGGLYEIALESEKITRIDTPEWAGVRSIAWLPDGRGMLVAAYDREQPPQVWFVPRGEGVPRKVTSDLSSYSSIQIAADGRSFTAVRDEPDANIAIVSLDRPDDVKAVTSGIGNGFGYGGVQWLSDQKILFSAYYNGKPALLSVDAAGGDPVRIAHSVNAWHPSVSPDGKLIAFTSDSSGPAEIWTALAAGDSPRQLTRGRAGRASFSANGASIVYLSAGDSQFAFRIPSTGGKPEQLTETPTSRAHLSHDGRELLCRLRTTDGLGPLWRTAVIPVGARARPRYFDVPRFGVSPELQWMPDGRGFVFIDRKDGIANLWLQNVEGGEPRQMTSFTAGEIFAYDVAADGKQVALSRGNPMSDVVLIRNFR